MSEIRRIVMRRARNALITVFGIILLNFFLIHIMGEVTTEGHPEELFGIHAPNADPATAYFNCQLFGLCGPDNKSLPLEQRFVIYVQNLVSGNWGLSLHWKGRNVVDVVMPALTWTLFLVGTSTVVTILLGMAIGSRSAQARGKPFDFFATGFSLFFYGMPFFWLALVLQLGFTTRQFGLNWWPMFPSSQEYDVRIGAFSWLNLDHVLSALYHLILPAGTLAIGYLAGVSLVMRNALVDVMTEDYVVTARAKGLSERLILRRHILPNGLPPMVTLIALDMAFIFGGAYQVEYVFSYEGIGWVTIQAIFNQDFPVIQFVVVIGGIAVIIANFIADLILVKIDPRIKIA